MKIVKLADEDPGIVFANLRWPKLRILKGQFVLEEGHVKAEFGK